MDEAGFVPSDDSYFVTIITCIVLQLSVYIYLFLQNQYEKDQLKQYQNLQKTKQQQFRNTRNQIIEKINYLSQQESILRRKNKKW